MKAHLNGESANPRNSKQELRELDRKIQETKQQYRGSISYRLIEGLKFWAGGLAVLGGLFIAGISINNGIADLNNIIQFVFSAAFIYAGYYTITTLGREHDNLKREERNRISESLDKKRAVQRRIKTQETNNEV